ncbi:MAG: hypothetical protein ACI362_04590 [Coriobacteriales bacterium]
MDSRVSARIPSETREQGDRALKKIGATTTQLINAAYEYLLSTGELPQAPHPAHSTGELTKAQRAQLQARLEQTTRKVSPEFFAEMTDDELLEQELLHDYETLA